MYAGVNCTVDGKSFYPDDRSVLQFRFCQIHDFDIMFSLYNHVTVNFAKKPLIPHHRPGYLDDSSERASLCTYTRV